MQRLTPVLVTAAVLLAGCSDGADSPASSATSTPASSPTEETATQGSTVPSSSGTASSTTSDTASEGEAVAEVAARFSTLAPASLFEQFDTCSATGMPGSFDCSGAEIGQFQLFDSDAKAASTTQLLTELRSSRIVEDSGTRVVGWSTLGTSAIITVVDNEKGQVMQQLISSDQEDPRERIHKLGLSEKAAETASPTTSPTTSPAASAPATP